MIFLCLALAVSAAPADRVVYAGTAGPGVGKHIVLLTGDEEYRSEEGLPMLARVLARRHGFRCTVLFAIDPKDGTINPTVRDSLPGADALDSADLIVMMLRYREYPDAVMKHFVDAYLAGKPIVALRTSTHAFHYRPDSTSAYKKYHSQSKEWPGGFGKQVLGETWVNHHGRHKQEATRGVLEPAAHGHPILRGVAEIFGDTDVYGVSLPADATVLVRGEVVAGMKPTDPPVAGAKNDPMMPIAWTRTPTNEAGRTNRVFVTTMGAATDLANEGLRRLVVNGVFWGLNLDVPEKADVTIVGEYRPSPYSFNGHRKGVRPSDLADAAATPIKGDDLLKPGPKPPRAELPPSALPLQLLDGERIALVGNSTAERMNLFGHFESLLHSRFPEKQLVVRNFARPADEVGIRQRPGNYSKLDDPLAAFSPDTFLCFFGFNESFRGPDGLDRFRADYERFLNEYAEKYPRDDAGRRPRFVLITPAAFENTGDPHLPDGTAENDRLARYSEAVRAVAAQRGLAAVDLFTPTRALFGGHVGKRFTINGCHLNEAGDREVARVLDRALFGSPHPNGVGAPKFEQLRAAVNDKSFVHAQDYRMLNGWYVYGGRRTWDTETFPREYRKIRAMAAVRDRYCWDIAAGRPVPPQPDDSATGELYTPPTRFGDPRQSYSEPKELRYLSPEESIAAMTVPEGFLVELFASEREFPELANPVQLNFDSKGRLWVACMPTYPQWKPGDPKPNDRLLIFEDLDGDGKADTCKIFYDQLHCPTGFEFFDGGVLVTDQPRLIWLKDSDGDDVADVVVHLLDGWGTDDTHHSIGAFEWSHGGRLHMLEGVAMSTTVETPRGPFRHNGTPGAYVFDPRTWRIRHFVTPGYGNPWCMVFDRWGQGFVGDGTGGQQHWDSPLSGAQNGPRRGLNPVFNNNGIRPVVGSEFLVTRQFPPEVQGQFTYACVINMNGLPRWHITEDGSGFTGQRVCRPDGKTPDDLVKSTDKNFRPTDPQIGPDGALWFGDWYNPLIGHMQYSQRDPNRDKQHGRIYRLVHKDRNLLEPATQHGKPTAEVLEQLLAHEDRTAYRARRELRDRPPAETLAEARAWLAKLDPNDPNYDRMRCELLWLQQNRRAIDEALVRDLMRAKTPQARAAAVRVAADEHEQIAGAAELLAAAVSDDHPRVRLEAVRGLSLLPSLESAEAALRVLDRPTDYWIDYTLQHTLGALEPYWRPAYQAGQLAKDNPARRDAIASYDGLATRGKDAARPLQLLLNPDTKPDARRRAYEDLVNLRGDAKNGKAVFARSACLSCHKVGAEGVELGPELTLVAGRLNRFELIESILEPNAKLDEKYLTTILVTDDGKRHEGAVIREDGERVVLRVQGGEEKSIPKTTIEERSQAKQSSMPENLAASISPGEFLDLIEYMVGLK